MVQKKSSVRIGLLLASAVLVFAVGCAKDKGASTMDDAEAKAAAAREAAAREADVTKRTETVVAPSSDRDRKAAESAAVATLPGSREVAAPSAPATSLKAIEAQLQTVYFNFDKSDLTEEARNALAQNARILQANPTAKVVIEGHCDERGTVEYNLALGERRADSAKKYLTSLGTSESRLTTVSYGEEKPAESGQTEEAWAKNRRAQFVVTE